MLTAYTETYGLRTWDGMMHVAYDISAGLAQDAGIGRYARELARALHQLPDGPELLLFHNRQPLDRLPPDLYELPRVGSRLSDRQWRFWLLLKSGFPGGPAALPLFDLYHGPDFLVPRLQQPCVVTIHDLSTLIYPSHHTLLHRFYSRLALPRVLQRTAAIIAVSQATRRDLIERLHVPAEKVHVIYNGLDHGLFAPQPKAAAQARVQAELNVPRGYLLALGTLEPRKNLVTLLRAFACLDGDKPDLVLVGQPGWGEISLDAEAERLGIADRLHVTGFVPDALLPDLYSGAELFIYPSLYEGFGLPVLEAMACGAPVITSNTSSLPEVAGDAAVLIDPTDVSELAWAITALLANPAERAAMRQRGIVQAQKFRWHTTALQTAAVYQQVLNTKSGGADRSS